MTNRWRSCCNGHDEVRWLSLEPCWLCGNLGGLAGSPLIAPTDPDRLEVSP